MSASRHLIVCMSLTLLACHGEAPPQAAMTQTTDEPAKTSAPTPPVAKQVPETLTAHGHERVDEYYWLRERESAEVIGYLEAENAYTDEMTAHTAELRTTLEDELAGRLQQDDSSVPFHNRGYYYYARYEVGGDYPLYCRKQGSLDAPEEVYLDTQALAAGHDYFAAHGLALSEDQQLLAYATDTVGRRIYTLRVKDLRSGELLPDEVPEVTGNVVWAADNHTLFYAKQDPQTLRSDRIYRHVLGTDAAKDVLVYEETDETFRVGIGKTRSREYLVISSSQTLSDEARVLAADDPLGEFEVFSPRERGLEYSVDHYDGKFYVQTNLDAQNFRLMTVAEPKRKRGKQQALGGKTGKATWRELVGHQRDAMLVGYSLFHDHLVTAERREGLIELHVRAPDGKEDHVIDFGEPAYIAFPSGNADPDTTTLRYRYASMTTPNSVFDYDMGSKAKQLLKQDTVLGGFDSANYVTERVWAKARDGAAVPISLAYHKDTPRDGSAPLLLYGYGSYGSTMSASFSSDRLSLLDRGFVWAIAHVRGGQELGRQWYEHGKLLEKKNTFTDFIDCGEHLVAERYASADKLYAYGGSAGGLLVGAVINMRPDLFHGVIAAVPFVDVVTTMLDDSIPLTTSEYDEWGNPNDKQYYDYMLSYSPYDNVAAKDYPALLVTTGLHDSQVQYWEPAKWVARLRATKTDHNPLLLKTNMSAGHGGKSGRLRRYEETAFKYAFLLDLAGTTN